MARDNAACNRAIRKAWARERELVLAGKGSRNWTPEQREQLITKGKVYDADGKAFIGQHMKSVSGFPDNQGDADNIQLLSQEEHLEAHKGDWHNVTNWYYDPDTKTFYDFEVYDYSKFPPDNYINFRPEEAIIPVDSSSKESQEKQAEEDNPAEKKKEEPPKPPKSKTPTLEKPKPEPPKPKIEPPKKPGFLSRVRKGVKSVWTETVSPVITDTIWPYVKEHPLQTIAGVITTVGGIVGVFSQSTSNNDDSEKSFTSDILRPEDKSGSDYPKPDISDLNSTQNEEKEETDIAADTSERPYTPNDVPAGGQHYHYKDGSVKWKEKGSYSRGKKKKDEE